MIKILRELINPELKSNKHYDYVELEAKTNCIKCGKNKRKGMWDKEKSEFHCSHCYIMHIGNELKVTLSKRKLALYIAGLTFLLIIQFTVIGYLAYPKTLQHGIDSETREFLIETFYPLSDKRMDKAAFVAVVDAILEHSDMPELAFAIIYNESLFFPGAVSSTGARGLHQIISRPGHVPELIEANIIKDVRDLHGNVTGVKAGNYIMRKKLDAVNGDLPKALMNYHGHPTNHASNVRYMQNVLQTYGFIKYSQQAKAKSPSWQEVEIKASKNRGRK